ncbi:ribosome biogenesis protein NOP53-like [Teratosphaeria destructans]|uniref:Ribosome biogenesis protein NOP53 n=1 Tax=Teratosphaeria destructans TaxID=418781 RepID=A0A9W7SSD9_9PEZI|nr:ribosome biogenesis protein NOP53-like [Teratosphaeria destructans]
MGDTQVAAPATHKQPSRKGKKAWRKNVDLTEVQSGLENVRDEIIKTGGVIAEQPADALFATDLAGDEEIAKQFRGKKLLKCDEILAQRSPVPGLAQHKKRKLDEIQTPGRSKRTRNGTYIGHKELQRLRSVADGANVGFCHVEENGASYDPWDAKPKVQDPRFSFLEEKKDKVAPETLKLAPQPLVTHGKAVPNVRQPEAGKSYNPLVTDWSALLQREGAAAVEAEKARLQAEAEAAEKEARAKAEAEKVEKMEKDEYATDYESAWESEWEGFQSGAEEEVHTQKMPRRKTPSERNKIKARKEREARERWEKKQKIREEQESKIAQIAKEMSVKDKARRPQAQALQAPDDSWADEDGVQLQKRRFGKLPIPAAPLEVVLPDELQDSLRRLKPEGNLLTDRYRNLLINGKLEVRKRRDKAQYKGKKTQRTEKWSYKDWKLK